MVRTEISEQDLEQVRDIVARTLAERFGPEGLVFDPIIVKPDLDQDGDDILLIKIIFDGDPEQLDPRWTMGIVGRIYPKMKAIPVTAYPITYFIEKSEWEDPYNHLFDHEIEGRDQRK